MNKKIISIALMCLASVSVYAESHPRGVATDHRVKVVQYDPNNVVVLIGRYGYQTQITFAPNETVQSVSIGDSMAWQAVPVQNNLFVKPVADSMTNMTVLTTAHSYNLQLDSTKPNVSPTYKLQFNYPEGGFDQAGNANAIGTFDPAKINWKYSFTGDRDLVPDAVFDNGQFTYFKYEAIDNESIPSIFIVDKNKNETLVNYHRQGDYLVVNSVAKQYTLRDGESVTSIYNDLAIGDWRSVK